MSVTVRIPSPLRPLTGGAATVECAPDVELSVLCAGLHRSLERFSKCFGPSTSLR